MGHARLQSKRCDRCTINQREWVSLALRLEHFEHMTRHRAASAQLLLEETDERDACSVMKVLERLRVKLRKLDPIRSNRSCNRGLVGGSVTCYGLFCPLDR